MGLSDARNGKTQPASLDTNAKDEAAGLQLAAGEYEMRAHHASNGGVTSISGSNKRRLTPMELKQQQRLKREQRKRAKLASSQCLPTPPTIPAPASSRSYDFDWDKSNSDGTHIVLEGARASDALEAPAANAAASPPSRLVIAKEPLRRSASSPSLVSFNTAGLSKTPPHLERHHTPPTRHLVVEESHHPIINNTTAVPTLLPSGEALADPSSPGATLLGMANGSLDSIQERCNDGGDAPDGGRGRPGDRGDAERSSGVSLFHMVMSRASCSASSSSAMGEGTVGGEGIGRMSKNLSGGGRKGGRISTSSLSSLLRGRRESARAELGDDNLSRGGELSRRKKNAGGTEEDWMAMNLEKLSSFRVPETRMGFPSSEGDRKGLRRCATAPTASDGSSGALGNGEESVGARSRVSRRASTAKLGGHSGIQRWYLGSTDPMGRVACDGNAPLTPAMTPDADFPASAISGDDRGGANVLMDQTLRTRVRFEMAPGVLIPPEIGSLPGDVENSALRIFAAGGALDDLSRRHRRQRQRARPELLTERVLSRGDSLSGGGGSGCAGGNGKGGWEQDVLFTSKERKFAPVEEGVHRGEEGRACVGDGINSAPVLDETSARLADEAVETAKLEEALEEWRRATLYWMHPATPLPVETFSAKKAAYAEIAKRPGQSTKVEGGVHPGGSAASGWNSFFWSRRRDWEQAFISLYNGLLARRRGDGACSDRGGEGPVKGSFYLQCPRFTVLWRLVREEGSSGGSGRLIPAAAMSQSTRRLRKRLKAAGIEFNMPLDPAGDQRDAEEDKELLEEWKAMGATGNAKPGAVYSNEEERSRPHLSLLTFRGQMAVNGLFDYLLEMCGSSSEGVPGSGTVTRGSSRGRGGGSGAADVPLLLSLEPFINASLKALKVRQKGMMHRSRASMGSSEATDIQVLELVGHVLPSSLAGLTLAMASACTVLQTPPSDSTPSGVAEAVMNKQDSVNNSSSGGGIDRGHSGKVNTKRCAEASEECDRGSQGSRFPRMADESEGLNGDAEKHEPWLFRVLGTVDGETKYLNAGFGSMESGEAKGSNALGSYVMESRVRFVSSNRTGRQMVFDVCATDPIMQIIP